jgi:hypothetical protein
MDSGRGCADVYPTALESRRVNVLSFRAYAGNTFPADLAITADRGDFPVLETTSICPLP